MSLDISCNKLKHECPLDGQCSWGQLYVSEKYKLPVCQCGNCGLQAIAPPARQKPEDIYDNRYYEGNDYYDYKDERSSLKYENYVWDARIRNIRKYIKNGNFLDIGSSFGGFLQRAKHAGFEPYGIEISSYAANYANENGIPTFNGPVEKSGYSSAFFSVITLIEVIEHLENPDVVFTEISRLLAPGGLLVIQTANFNGWQAINEKEKYHYYLPGHVYYYTDELLINILERHGFNKFKIYYGVDFPLIAKLKKSQGKFNRLTDYLAWIRIGFYHFKSKIFKSGRPLTSSMVIYAFK